jgi:hypothetical protein
VCDAVTLARWIGTGRRAVTAGQVLRKADVAAAGAALGVEVPPKLRTMADIRALHRPWCVGVATGLLQVDDGWVTGGPALAGWPPGDADLLAGWLAGLRTVCAAESEITLEKTLPRDPRQDYPVCLAFRGDSPVEYWSEEDEDPEEPEPFDLAEVNRKLAALGREAGA